MEVLALRDEDVRFDRLSDLRRERVRPSPLRRDSGSRSRYASVRSSEAAAAGASPTTAPRSCCSQATIETSDNEDLRFFGTQGGPPEHLLSRPLRARWGAGWGPVIGVTKAFDEVHRQQASEQPLLAPPRLVHPHRGRRNREGPRACETASARETAASLVAHQRKATRAAASHLRAAPASISGSLRSLSSLVFRPIASADDAEAPGSGGSGGSGGKR